MHYLECKKQFFYLLAAAVSLDYYLAVSVTAADEAKGEVVQLSRPDVNLGSLLEVEGRRPVRKDGILLEVETDPKGSRRAIVHNYGYGSSGHTLAPGGAAYCRNLLEGHEARKGGINRERERIAVVGAGVVGLTMTNVLLSAGYKVTLYAESVSPNTTSDVAAGLWAASTTDRGKLPEQFFRTLENVSYHYFRDLIVAGNPHVHQRPIYAFSAKTYLTTLSTVVPMPRPKPVTVSFTGGEEPPVVRTALATSLPQIDTTAYLGWLSDTIKLKGEGGAFVCQPRHFSSRAQLWELPEPMIVNCSGAGIDDASVELVAGRLVHLPPQAGVDYMVTRAAVVGTNNATMMIPRNESIIIGGSYGGEQPPYQELVDNARSFFWNPKALLIDPVPID